LPVLRPLAETLIDLNSSMNALASTEDHLKAYRRTDTMFRFSTKISV